MLHSQNKDRIISTKHSENKKELSEHSVSADMVIFHLRTPEAVLHQRFTCDLSLSFWRL